jgi:hypothetical protein
VRISGIEHRLLAFRYDCVKVNDLTNTVADRCQSPSGDHPSVTVSEQNRIGMVFSLHVLHEIRYVCTEVDVFASQMSAFANASPRRSEQLMASYCHQWVHLLPSPAC